MLTLHHCQNCAGIWRDDDLRPVKDLHMRVDAGEPMPSGECPSCGALCQPEHHPEEALKPFSILLEWEDGNDESGTYAWAGLAPDYATAVRLARLQSLENIEIDAGEDPEDHMASEHVLDSYEGANMWAAKEMLDALIMVRDADNDCRAEGLNAIPPAARAKIDTAIARGEGRS